MDHLLTIEEVGERLRLSRSTVYCLMRERRLTPLRFGRAVRFKASEVQALVEAVATAPDPDASGPRAGVGRAA